MTIKRLASDEEVELIHLRKWHSSRYRLYAPGNRELFMCEFTGPESCAAMDEGEIAQFYLAVKVSLYALQGSECRSTGMARW